MDRGYRHIKVSESQDVSKHGDHIHVSIHLCVYMVSHHPLQSLNVSKTFRSRIFSILLSDFRAAFFPECIEKHINLLFFDTLSVCRYHGFSEMYRKQLFSCILRYSQAFYFFLQPHLTCHMYRNRKVFFFFRYILSLHGDQTVKKAPERFTM